MIDEVDSEDSARGVHEGYDEGEEEGKLVGVEASHLDYGWAVVHHRVDSGELLERLQNGKFSDVQDFARCVHV